MARLTTLFKKVFKGKGKPEESPEVLRSVFKVRYWSFKTLLNANNATLEIISDMERALHGTHGFGMAFIRANCTAVSVNVYKIIQNMNEISSNRYAPLFDVFGEIRDKVNRVLDERKGVETGEWALPLEALNKEAADQVGSKMANLGEIRNRVGLPVPEGFAITASAYNRFLEYNNLQEEINRRIQPLDLEDMEMLHKASADIQQLMIRSQLPPELEEAIQSHYRGLEEKTQKGMNVSLRSSAVGEDTEKSSFAGQYRSELNVNHEFLGHTYKEILASKYTPQAMTYRLTMGFKDEDSAMCVGCMAMVDAVSSGVMYSRDPGNIRNKVVLINAVWGLAKTVVDGTVSPDLFVVSKESPRQILKKEIRRKDQKFVCLAEEGVCQLALVDEEKDHAAISDDHALALAQLADRLEDHYGAPQDIEWSIGQDGVIRILQSRPLRQLDVEKKAVEEVTAWKEVEAPVLLEGGVTASPGIATGPAFVVKTTVDLLQFPSGAVLITEHSLPQWAAALSRAAAVITDRGGIAGHLATVSREFRLPALFDTVEATSKIKNGTILTVDAEGRKVYEGKVESLLREASAAGVNLMRGSPVYNTLEKALQHISPLNLTDPDGPSFKPEACQTYHDITRFCHEKAVKEMFSFGKDHHFPERSSKQLVCDIPVKWWVIDLEDGFKEPVDGDKVKLENIASVPMLALWEGITAIPWKGPPPVDAKGFAAIMFRSTMDPSLDPARQSRYAEKNYFMISKNFCNLASRFGYHFSTVEAFINDRPKENYVTFSFKGGAADLDRRVRRIKFIEHILKQFDFRIEINEDWMAARLEGNDQDFMIERLKVLGYVSMHTRQLDMIMGNQAKVNYYINEHIKDIRSFVSI
ncbi:MAG: PEP/pyruvate-binding domain-containing protein [Thermodesulfobacteriota bacterium]|nr:PEP/pyruvate-binding domain-containing protein [Thermodesulfobacteriota bacterium]